MLSKILSTPLRHHKCYNSYHNLKIESVRENTFKNWPHESWLPKSKLAAAGFYFLKEEDKCACSFCKGIVWRWEKHDDPMSEHKLHFPNCPFVRNKPVGNIPKMYDKILLKFLNYSLNRQRKIIEFKTPEHPQYVHLKSRLRSYVHWPKNLPVKPMLLAEAGFYYTALGDMVTCFHCGGGLYNWEDGDDPWTSHAHWYPECMYVSLMNKPILTENDLDLLINYDIPKDMIRMGFPATVVKEAIRNKINSDSLPFYNLDSGIEAVLRVMEENVRKKMKEEKEERQMCLLCNTREINITFLPCSHAIACQECTLLLSTSACPICRRTMECIKIM